jgi:hypothetical protein
MNGKQMCGAKASSAGKDGWYMVSAWVVGHGIVLGQRKSNEISAIPELLHVLAVEGCVVTIDAMGCQTEIAEKIINQQADYMLTVKGNQKTLAENLAETSSRWMGRYLFAQDFTCLIFMQSP